MSFCLRMRHGARFASVFVMSRSELSSSGPVVRTNALIRLGLVILAGAFASTSSASTARLRGWIVYWSENPRPTIRAVRPDGSRDHAILATLQNAKRPRLSPDRVWVAFDGAPPGKTPMSDFDIQVVRLDGTGLRALTSTPDWDTDAQWSPDGMSLSFTRSPPSPAIAAAPRFGS